MSRKYALSRVKDALEKSEGNHLKAQRLIVEWLKSDQSLLLGLVEPHLMGIVTYAVTHADAPQEKTEPAKISTKSVGGSELGAALIDGMQGKTASFGEASTGAESRPGPASQRHIDAINKLAGVSKAGKKSGK